MEWQSQRLSLSSDQPTIQTSNTRGMGSKLITQETRTCYQNGNEKQIGFHRDCASYSNLHKNTYLTQCSAKTDKYIYIHIYHKQSYRSINLS